MNTIGTLISWAVFGLVVGAIARFIYPGKQDIGLLTTMLLGITGSFVGGFISWMMGFDPAAGAFRGAGWIMSIIGALIVVAVSLYLMSRNSGARPTA
jgi:uncharacterized membrane protein YeaQ/YmgE (transglycosylase-associated protein family)